MHIRGHNDFVTVLRNLKNKVTNLLLDNRVNYICSADYQEGSDLDSLVKCIMQEMQLSHTLLLKQKQQRTRESKNVETKN